MGGDSRPASRQDGEEEEGAGAKVVTPELEEVRVQLLGAYNINDNADILSEILARLDGSSLAAAAYVCRLWAAVSRRDAVWEALCLRHVGPTASGLGATRAVVGALGGYRRLYRLCLGPALDRLGLAHAQARARLSLSLSLSLFSIDCYERLGGGGAGAGAGAGRPPPPPSSLLFLCKPVDVS